MRHMDFFSGAVVADGNLQEQLARVYRKMITPKCAEIMMGYPEGWTDLDRSETP